MLTAYRAFASTSTSALGPAALTRLLHGVPAIELPTIFAPATGPTRSAISILRISGPMSLQIYHNLTTPPKTRVSGPRSQVAVGKRKGRAPEPRKALLRRIVDPGTGEVLDEGIVLYFPGKLFNHYGFNCRVSMY